MDFTYVLEKIQQAEMLDSPFRHIAIENLFNEQDLAEIIGSSEISLDQAALKPGMGSARSACGLNLHQALEHCDQHLVSHGGHAAAAGLKIEESQLDEFREEFCEYVAR